MTIKYTTDGKTIAKHITAWAKAKAVVTHGLHILTISTIVHAIKHGDVTLINKLDEACRDGVDKRGKTASSLHLTGFREFVRDNGPVTWRKRDANNDEGWLFNKKRAAELKAELEANEKAYVDMLLATPFWHLKGQKAFEGFDLNKQLMSLVKRAENVRDDDDKASHPKTNVALLDALARFMTENRVAN